jgi:hypothetical protein
MCQLPGGNERFESRFQLEALPIPFPLSRTRTFRGLFDSGTMTPRPVRERVGRFGPRGHEPIAALGDPWAMPAA